VDALESRLNYLNDQYSLQQTFNFEQNTMNEEEYIRLMKVSNSKSDINSSVNNAF